MKIADEEVHTLLLDKGSEKWVFMYHPRYRKQVLHILSKWAANQELNFNWYDAARLSQEVRAAK